jgi:hypothetical protein
MKRAIVCLLVISLGLLLKSCNTTEPPPPPDGDKPTLNLTLEDVSCTEAWIELTTTNLQLPATITLKQINPTGDTLSHISILNTQDSLLYIDSLLPNKSYQYQVTSIEYPASSNELSVTTMDTTSHEFTFETFTFGDISNSYLFDVAILNENSIWAVGEIRIADTSAIGYTKYNAVHWDGSEWTLHRIMFYTICGQQHRSAYPAISVVAFSENDVWIAMYGNQVARLNDTTQIGTYCIPISVRKMWGTDSQNLYAVGVNGQIAHRNNVGWQVIESGTDVDFLDVWGTPDGSIVWACGETIYKTVLIKIENNQANVVFEGTYPMPQIKNRFSDGLLSLWTNKNNFIYVLSPYNLYRCKVTTTGEGQELYPYDDYFKGAYLRLRGTGINNLITSGNKSTITHFNGISWKIYDELRNEDQLLRGLDVNENLLVTVGDKFENTFYYKAIVIVGSK